MKICAIIPSFNVAKTIGDIVSGVKQMGIDAVVVDDGSSDGTAEIARKSQAIVLRNNVNKGKGASLRLGFDFAISNGYEAVITMDGDGQHSLRDLPKFTLALEDNKADVIIGSRMFNPRSMPFIRWLTNKVMSLVISFISRQEVSDSQSGFRLIKARCLKALKFKSNRFEIESEIILEAANNGFKVASIPVSSIYINSESRINPLLDTFRFIKFILPYLLFEKGL